MTSVLRFLVGWLSPRRNSEPTRDERRSQMIKDTEGFLTRRMSGRGRSQSRDRDHDWPGRHAVQERRKSSKRRWS